MAHPARATQKPKIVSGLRIWSLLRRDNSADVPTVPQFNRPSEARWLYQQKVSRMVVGSTSSRPVAARANGRKQKCISRQTSAAKLTLGLVSCMTQSRLDRQCLTHSSRCHRLGATSRSFVVQRKQTSAVCSFCSRYRTNLWQQYACYRTRNMQPSSPACLLRVRRPDRVGKLLRPKRSSSRSLMRR